MRFSQSVLLAALLAVVSECRLAKPTRPVVLNANSKGGPEKEAKKDGKGKEKEKKDGGEEEKSEAGCVGPCCKDPEVLKKMEEVEKVLEKKGADDSEFMDKFMAAKEAMNECRAKQGKEATEKAEKKMEEHEDHPMLQPGFASIGNRIINALRSSCQEAGPKKKEKKAAKKGEGEKAKGKGGKKGKGDEAGCADVCCKDPEVKKKSEEMEEALEKEGPGEKFMDKVLEVKKAMNACREKNGKKASKKADAKMEEYEEHPMMQPGFVSKK